MPNLEIPSIVFLTGAGISAESGLRTFRASDGLWENHPVEQVATPEGFVNDPELVHNFYNQRRAQQNQATPNAAHKALARFARTWPGQSLVVTQNIDDLHERAGATDLIHMHGELNKTQCTHCAYVGPSPQILSIAHSCPSCRTGRLRPNVVWFGEMPLQMDQINSALQRCGLFIAIGTSGNVYPAAGYVEIARFAGAHCIEVNLAGTSTSMRFHEHRTGAATVQLEPLLNEVLEKFA